MAKIYFTPGPSQLYPTVEQHLQKAVFENIGSISHRSSDFQRIYQSLVENLRELLNIPQDFAILCTSSATEIWERILMNCVDKTEKALFCVNGAFSERFYSFAQTLQKNAIKQEILEGQGFDFEKVQIQEDTKLVAITHNETSTGARSPNTEIHKIKEKYSSTLLAVDIVSSVPIVELDFSLVDIAYFSVQKAFGLPAGLGIWIVNLRCLEKAKELEAKNEVIGTYHSLPNLWKYFTKYQTPETPNVLAIYLLSKVTGDMLNKGISKIRQESKVKAGKIYNFIEKSNFLNPFVENKKYQSETVIVAKTKKKNSEEIITRLDEDDIIIGSGYKNFKTNHIRIANFPTHNLSEIERLLESLSKI